MSSQHALLDSHRSCFFVISFGVDTGRNYTAQREAVAETWASEAQSDSVYFVTDGWVPNGWSKIALQVTDLDYWDGPVMLFKLIQYIHGNVLDCGFYHFTDSDSYVNVRNVRRSLEDRTSSECIYAGYIVANQAIRAAHGTLITMSRKLILEMDPNYCLEQYTRGWFDIQLGQCLQDDLGLRISGDGGELFKDILNTDDVEKEWFHLQKTRHLPCMLALHKVVNSSFMFDMHSYFRDHTCNISRRKRIHTEESCSRLVHSPNKFSYFILEQREVNRQVHNQLLSQADMVKTVSTLIDEVDRVHRENFALENRLFEIESKLEKLA